MTTAKAEFLERNRQLLEQMEKLRQELEQSRNNRQAQNPPVPPATALRSGASITPAPVARLGGRKSMP